MCVKSGVYGKCYFLNMSVLIPSSQNRIDFFAKVESVMSEHEYMYLLVLNVQWGGLRSVYASDQGWVSSQGVCPPELSSLFRLGVNQCTHPQTYFKFTTLYLLSLPCPTVSKPHSLFHTSHALFKLFIQMSLSRTVSLSISL